jgi:hypothetical protein
MRCTCRPSVRDALPPLSLLCTFGGGLPARTNQTSQRLLSFEQRVSSAKNADTAFQFSSSFATTFLLSALCLQAAASAPTPRTTRRAAAASAAAASDEEEEQPQAVAPRTTRRRAAAKKAAEPPPEPEALTEPEPEAEEQAAETPPPPRGTPRRRSAAADKAAFRAAAATPLTKSRGPSPAPRPPIGAVGSPLFLLLLLAAAGSLAAYFARPFCQQRDCGELLRNLPDLAVESAAGSYGVLRERALAAAYALQAHASTAVSCPGGNIARACGSCGSAPPSAWLRALHCWHMAPKRCR